MERIYCTDLSTVEWMSVFHAFHMRSRTTSLCLWEAKRIDISLWNVQLCRYLHWKLKAVKRKKVWVRHISFYSKTEGVFRIKQNESSSTYRKHASKVTSGALSFRTRQRKASWRVPATWCWCRFSFVLQRDCTPTGWQYSREEKEPRRVGFGHMVILDFPCVLGDNPSVSVGTPIAMSPGIDRAESWESTSMSKPTPLICASKKAPWFLPEWNERWG
jgi:hypothetical protein